MFETIMEAVKWVMANYLIVIEAVLLLLSGAILIAMLIPGEQPEKALQGVVDFIKKFSAKPEVKPEELK